MKNISMRMMAQNNLAKIAQDDLVANKRFFLMNDLNQRIEYNIYSQSSVNTSGFFEHSYEIQIPKDVTKAIFKNDRYTLTLDGAKLINDFINTRHGKEPESDKKIVLLSDYTRLWLANNPVQPANDAQEAEPLYSNNEEDFRKNFKKVYIKNNAGNLELQCTFYNASNKQISTANMGPEGLLAPEDTSYAIIKRKTTDASDPKRNFHLYITKKDMLDNAIYDLVDDRLNILVSSFSGKWKDPSASSEDSSDKEIDAPPRTILSDSSGTYDIIGPFAFKYNGMNITNKSRFKQGFSWNKAVEALNAIYAKQSKSNAVNANLTSEQSKINTNASTRLNMKNISMRKIAAYNNDLLQYPIAINNDTDTDLTLTITPTQGIGNLFDKATQAIGIGGPQTIKLEARSSYTFGPRIKSIAVSDGYSSSYHDTNQLAELVSYDEAKRKYSVNISQLFTPSAPAANTNTPQPPSRGGQTRSAAPAPAAPTAAAPAPAPAAAPTAAAPAAPAPAPAAAPTAAEKAEDSKVKEVLKSIFEAVLNKTLKIDISGIDFRAESKVWRGVIKGLGGAGDAASKVLTEAGLDNPQKLEIQKVNVNNLSSISRQSYLSKIHNYFYGLKKKYVKSFAGMTVASEDQIAKAVGKGLGGEVSTTKASEKLHTLHTLSKVAARRERAKKSLDSVIEKEASVEDDMTSKIERRRAAVRAKLGL